MLITFHEHFAHQPLSSLDFSVRPGRYPDKTSIHDIKLHATSLILSRLLEEVIFHRVSSPEQCSAFFLSTLSNALRNYGF